MRELNPTLWRTCRMLSGRVRMQLLRQLLEHPDQSISQLALAVGIGVSDGSQELRRIQSRGFLQAERKGPFVIYRLVNDPQVPSAGPLSAAVRNTMLRTDAAEDSVMNRMAFGLAHPRRIAIAKILMSGAHSLRTIEVLAQMPKAAVSRHLALMEECLWIQREKSRVTLTPPDHLLAKELVGRVKAIVFR